MPPLPTPNGIVNGTTGDDIINGTFIDADGDQIDNAGQVFAPRGPFDDIVLAGEGDDSVAGGAGDDQLWGGAGDDTLVGESGNDTLIGGDGSDVLTGNGGNNLLVGDGDNAPGETGGVGGDDTITGSTGNDTMLGGAGNDVFIVEDGFGNHVIEGGETGQAFRGDLLNASTLTQTVTVRFTGDEQGTITNGDSTLTFAEIEQIRLGAGDDTIEVVEPTSGKIGGGDGHDTLVIPGLGSTGPDAPRVTIELTVTNPDGSESYDGFVEFSDGSRLQFQKIEKIIPCFTPGTLIDTDRGPRAVETLVPGDRVLTRDHGFQPLVWAGRRDLPADVVATWPELAPIRIAAGALGAGLPARDLVVSPRHRMLVTGLRAEVLFGEREVLVAAADLLGLPGVTRDPAGAVAYVHVMCAAHQVIRAEGAWTESFQPQAEVLEGLGAPTRAELVRLFPELATGAQAFAAARPVLSAAEARLLVA